MQPREKCFGGWVSSGLRLQVFVRLLTSNEPPPCSLQTLYRKAFKKGPGIMVILDTKHNVSKSVLDRETSKDGHRFVLAGESLPPKQSNLLFTVVRAFLLTAEQIGRTVWSYRDA
jgi:hypothetical protein